MANWRRRKHQTIYSTTDLSSPLHTWQQEMPIEDPESFYKSTPSRIPTLESDVLVPLAQAAITGLLTAAATFPLVWYGTGDIKTAGLIATGTFITTVLGVWIIIITNYHRLLSAVEEIVKEAPPAPPAVNTVEIRAAEKANNFNSLLRFDLPPGVTESDLKMFLKAIANGTPLAMDNWTGNGKLFSRSSYNYIVGNLEKADYVALRNENAPNQGRVITENGKQNILEYLK